LVWTAGGVFVLSFDFEKETITGADDGDGCVGVGIA